MANRNNKLDQQKLQNRLDEEFGELGERLFNTLRKGFNNFKYQVDFRQFCEGVNKFVSQDPQICKGILFNILDQNKDKKLCETDLFNSFKLINDFRMQQLVQDDI